MESVVVASAECQATNPRSSGRQVLACQEVKGARREEKRRMTTATLPGRTDQDTTVCRALVSGPTKDASMASQISPAMTYMIACRGMFVLEPSA